MRNGSRRTWIRPPRVEVWFCFITRYQLVSEPVMVSVKEFVTPEPLVAWSWISVE